MPHQGNKPAAIQDLLTEPPIINQRAIFVIGAGRSGTSTVARALAALGVDLGDNFKRANRKNPTGFFEDADLLALSKAVRLHLGVRADSVRLIQADELQRPSLRPLQVRAKAIITKRFGNSPVWGFKYGRTLRILPFWEPVLADLAIEPSFVIALRNPLSVARSRARLDPRRGLQEASDLEWLVSIVPYLRRTQGYRLAVVDYD
ncbi:MAG: sulfotransferase family protein, partial [Wenzhouxiangella sp.]